MAYPPGLMAVLVDLERVTVRSPDRALFEELSLTVSDGDRLGVVGINGTGKSTLLRVLAGASEPESGSVRRGRGARVELLDQEPALPPGPVRAAVGEGWESEAILDRLGMGEMGDVDVAELSGGQAKRVALARVLARPSELLILDEPTNHLDLGAVTWLERFLAAYRGGLVLVSHDRHLLDRVTTRMLELDRGKRHLHDGGYGSYLEAKAARAEQAASADAVRRNLARRELAWLRRGAQARSTKAKARVDAANRLIAERPEAAARSGELGLKLGTPRLGDKVIELRDVAFRHRPDGPATLDDVNLLIAPDERLAVVGTNGTGKSTLLDLIAGRRAPVAGTIDVGPTVVVGYYDQVGVELDPDARLQDLVAGPHRTPGSLEDQALMERFWFGGDLPFARVGTLSGGERRRLQLLLVLAKRPNVLLLDEPTNDLDLDSLRILEEFLEEWPGALVVVSHDRTFLERTTERVLALDGDGSVSPVPGGLAGWISSVEQRSETAQARTARAAAAPQSHPVAKRPSTSTLNRQIQATDKEIARLTRQRDVLYAELTATTDYARLAVLGSDLNELQAALDAAEERWLQLQVEFEAAT
jgi:ATP-binding cassette subfamily F protein uup